MFKTTYSDRIISRCKTFRRNLSYTQEKVNLDFSRNDYLNFSSNQELLKAGIEAEKKYGVGATGSRLLSGKFYELLTL